MGVFKRWHEHKDGTKTPYWYYRLWHNGREIKRSVGEAGIVTKTQAKRVMEETKRRLRLGKFDIFDARIPTLGEFAEEYNKYVRDVKKKRSWSRDRELLSNLCKYFGDKRLSEITPKDIEDYKRMRLKEVKPATINRALSCLKHLFNLAKRWKKYFGDNPVSQVEFFEENNKLERVLTLEEEEKLLACSAPHLRPIILCALNTGMRKGEILNLKWSNIDMENNLITIEATNTKSKKPKRIYVNSTLRGILLEQRLKNAGGSEHVFLGANGEPIKWLRTAFENACRRANIINLRFHDLRHTAATRMVESGANIVAVSRILGHSTLSMTMRYAHPDASLREAVEKLGNLNSNRTKNRTSENSEEA
ncbi:MAG: tyrosine-type recombinase/integrase [Candidatus Dadabacteria bacterium]|jgi:integrase|nr:site-specific integrase [Candidatus Dadabacteria bacterium]MCZ6685670.1 tyrosine-type recombinase/integrase [Candidatus Dadabacteria bacterium]TDI91414.1 MAG: site-specific integrase [Candidatus Dadabacteria bacterium]TDJ01671.1 MAG: site-specific integrase [Candidatus Dadabacteria bacterium]